jgi:hypothetical protein
MGAAILRVFDGAVVWSAANTLKTEPDARPLALRDYLGSVVAEHGPFDAVVWELPFSMQRNSIAALHELIGALKLWAHDLGVPYYWVNTAKLRSQMGIKGRKREDVKAAIAEWYFNNVSDDRPPQDVMDAVLVGRWLLRVLEA